MTSQLSGRDSKLENGGRQQAGGGPLVLQVLEVRPMHLTISSNEVYLFRVYEQLSHEDLKGPARSPAAIHPEHV